MNQLFKSTTGRLMALSFAIALIGGGTSVLMHGEGATFLFSASLFVPIVINVAALPCALEEDWHHAVLSVIALPMLLFLWAVGIGVAREFHPQLGYPFIALGLAALGLAALGLAARPAHGLAIAPPEIAEQH